jgi:acetyltransferase-like isoleucine patch superfamily enzyme
VSFHSQEHNFEDVSAVIRDQGTTERGIVIGDDVWIGAKATILDGAVVGRHSVIAAGAVVRGQFPERSVLAGVPARLVRRISEE